MPNKHARVACSMIHTVDLVHSGSDNCVSPLGLVLSFVSDFYRPFAHNVLKKSRLETAPTRVLLKTAPTRVDNIGKSVRIQKGVATGPHLTMCNRMILTQKNYLA